MKKKHLKKIQLLMQCSQKLRLEEHSVWKREGIFSYINEKAQLYPTYWLFIKLFYVRLGENTRVYNIIPEEKKWKS